MVGFVLTLIVFNIPYMFAQTHFCITNVCSYFCHIVLKLNQICIWRGFYIKHAMNTQYVRMIHLIIFSSPKFRLSAGMLGPLIITFKFYLHHVYMYIVQGLMLIHGNVLMILGTYIFYSVEHQKKCGSIFSNHHKFHF